MLIGWIIHLLECIVSLLNKLDTSFLRMGGVLSIRPAFGLKNKTEKAKILSIRETIILSTCPDSSPNDKKMH